jgi:dGTPase
VVNEIVRRMINALIVDLIDTSKELIQSAQPKSTDDVRNTHTLIRFSENMSEQATQLKRFLRKNLYQHYQVNRMTSKARRIITELFEAFMREPTLMPPDYQEISGEKNAQARKVADYVAGMTDRYAMREYRRLFMVDEI